MAGELIHPSLGTQAVDERAGVCMSFCEAYDGKATRWTGSPSAGFRKMTIINCVDNSDSFEFEIFCRLACLH